MRTTTTDEDARLLRAVAFAVAPLAVLVIGEAGRFVAWAVIAVLRALGGVA